MKKTATFFALLLLIGLTRGQAQSTVGASSGQSGASATPASNGSKATSSQLEGKGVPYGKEKEQQQSRAAAKRSTTPAGQPTKSARKSGAKVGNASERNQ